MEKPNVRMVPISRMSPIRVFVRPRPMMGVEQVSSDVEMIAQAPSRTWLSTTAPFTIPWIGLDVCIPPTGAVTDVIQSWHVHVSLLLQFKTRR